MTTERLKYIFDQCVENEFTLRDSLKTPWIENDCIYATDSYIMLCVPNKNGRDKAFTDNGTKHPNASEILGFPFSLIDNFRVKVSELENIDDMGILEGIRLSKKRAGRVAKVLRLFGLDEAVFYVKEKCLVFFIPDETGEGILLMIAPNGVDRKRTTVNLNCTKIPDGTKFTDFNDDAGETYYQQCLKNDIEEEANNFPVYYVTLIKTLTVAVRANSINDAEKIARRYHDAWDFSSAEIDSVEESCRDAAEKEFKFYYDKDGQKDWEE